MNIKDSSFLSCFLYRFVAVAATVHRAETLMQCKRFRSRTTVNVTATLLRHQNLPPPLAHDHQVTLTLGNHHAKFGTKMPSGLGVMASQTDTSECSNSIAICMDLSIFGTQITLTVVLAIRHVLCPIYGAKIIIMLGE